MGGLRRRLGCSQRIHLATIGFTVFSVGYIAMARRVTAAGGFYSFASHGFGQTIGMGVALLIAACYLIFAAGVTGVTAYFANSTIDDWFGVDIPVWVFEFGTVAAMVMFAFFHIELTAKFLGFFLVLELISLLTFGICVLFQPQDGYVWSALLPWNFFDGDANGAVKAFGAGTIGVGIFGAFWSWIGFEMAPNYAEESKDPKRIMSPATYISVIGLGVLYTFICWMLVVAWGKNGITAGVTAQFNGDIASVFYPQTDRVFPIDIGSASLLTRAFQLTIVTGSFACQLAFFNTTTRYLFSMGREGILPHAIGRTHPKYKSPHVAAIIVGVLCALIIAGFLAYDSSTLAALLKLGTWAPMMGNIGILSIMGLVSLAIIRYFATEAKGEHGPLTRDPRPARRGGDHVRRDVPADRQPQHPQRWRRHPVRGLHVGAAARGVHRRHGARADLPLARPQPASTASAATCTRTSARSRRSNRSGRRAPQRAAPCDPRGVLRECAQALGRGLEVDAAPAPR